MSALKWLQGILWFFGPCEVKLVRALPRTSGEIPTYMQHILTHHFSFEM